ncbi:MAG TPA: YafY family protein [Candidatus Dormibacteraeota bacterium]|nr:YafY family protein [Candidatus Dormibacteraeota bacterium]
MKADRLLATLILLQARGRVAAREIAAELEVSERTVYRDADALSAAGIPVYAERGPRGGIVLADGYRTALTHLGEEEVRALFVSAANPLADLGLGDELAKTLEKLAGALPHGQRASARRVRDRIHLDPTRWNQAAQPRDHLSALQRAVWDDHCVRLLYRDREGAETDRVVEPLGLVAKAGIWYLVARSSGEMRVFRASRIRGVERSAQRFTRPDGFSLDRFWETWTSAFEARHEGYRAVVRAGPTALSEFRTFMDGLFELVEESESADGWQTVRLTFPGPTAAMAHLLMLGDAIEILEPAELRAKVLEAATAIIARHPPVPAP